MLAVDIHYPENPSIPDRSGFPLRYNLSIPDKIGMRAPDSDNLQHLI